MIQTSDILRFAFHAIRGFRLRSLLMMLAMAIGVAAVVVLTALGEGARGYVTREFASLGTDLLIVLPGRNETGGAGVALSVSGTPRDLTLEDALALQRDPAVRAVAPLVVGAAMASAHGLEREVPVLGSTAALLPVRKWELAQGQFLPPDDPRQAHSVCVLGSKVRQELFGSEQAIGEWVRLGDRRYRVIGILGQEGRSIGVDTEEIIVIPVAAAQQLFNTRSMFRILVEATHREAMPRVERHILDTIKARHHGEEDITVITQDAVLETFNRIFQALTLTVAGIGAISLAVAGILVMNVMLVAIAQRTTEIGLLKAIGASQRTILLLFMSEAGLMSLFGAAIGIGLGWLGSWGLRLVFPTLPSLPPDWASPAALAVALATGLIFGVMPARQAAALDPIQSLYKR